MNNYDVAIPVTVQIRAGQVIGAHVDFEGAPWPLTDSEPNVWNVDTEEWEQNHDLEDQAQAALDEAFTDFEAKLTELDQQARTENQ